MIKKFEDFINEYNEDSNLNHDKNYMIISNLEKIQRLSSELLKKIDGGSDIDEWVSDHISTSADDVEEVFNFLEGKK